MNDIPLQPGARAVAAGILAVALACGCESRGLVPVAGRVTFAGRAPPARGTVYFVPRDMTTDRRQDESGPLPGTALFATDGAFRATTFHEGDGLRPGVYEVRLECAAESAPRQLDEKTHDAPVRSAMPAGFAAPDLVVPASGSRPVRYSIDVR